MNVKYLLFSKVHKAMKSGSSKQHFNSNKYQTKINILLLSHLLGFFKKGVQIQ